MKTSFRPRLLNGQTGDPALLLTLRWQGRALLLDLGRIDRTPASVLLPIEAVFVSHAHMDHFMGFDQLLRIFLARDATLRLYGPAGLADCVAGKLAGYTWNLTDDYGFAIEVTEVSPREMTTWRFPARRRFMREPLGSAPAVRRRGARRPRVHRRGRPARPQDRVDGIRRQRAHAPERAPRRAGGGRVSGRAPG